MTRKPSHSLPGGTHSVRLTVLAVPQMLVLSRKPLASRSRVSAGRVAMAYPGTPSTEILENIARMEGVYAEWSINEKVAREVGLGAS